MMLTRCANLQRTTRPSINSPRRTKRARTTKDYTNESTTEPRTGKRKGSRTCSDSAARTERKTKVKQHARQLDQQDHTAQKEATGSTPETRRATEPSGMRTERLGSGDCTRKKTERKRKGSRTCSGSAATVARQLLRLMDCRQDASRDSNLNFEFQSVLVLWDER
jgi:hypothetical protein